MSTADYSTAAGSASIGTSAFASADSSAQRAELATNLIYYSGLLLLGIVGVFFLLALPRVAVRFTRWSELTEGLFLYSTTTKKSAHDAYPLSPVYPPAHVFIRSKRADDEKTLSPPEDASDIEDDYALETKRISMYDISKAHDIARVDRRYQYPVHMPALSTLFPGTSSFLARTVRQGYSIGKVLMLLAYTGLMLAVGLVQSNPFTDYNHSGELACAQIPVVVVLAVKNNVITWLIGHGYEKLNYLHRWAGRAVVLAVNIHSLGYIHEWFINGTVRQNLTPDIIWGLVALACMDVLFFFSLRAVREMFYQFFFTSHALAAIIVLPAICLHESATNAYIFIAVGFYGFDRLLRLFQARLAIARLHTMPELGMVRVTIPSVNAGWRAGQHLRIKVLSTSMGLTGWVESHPFTIASVSKCSSGKGIVLLIRKVGDWSNKLYSLAQRVEYSEAGGADRQVRVLIDGPYGGSGHAVFASFSGAVFVGGGSGITYPLSVVQDLVHKSIAGSSRVRVIELVWSVQDPSALMPLMPLFTTLLARAERSDAQLRISVSYTRAISPDNTVLDRLLPLPMGMTLTAGRPRIAKILDRVVDRTCELWKASPTLPAGVVVGVCGPAGLGEEVGRCVAGVSTERRKSVGGIELHEETFGW
ncbi:uncharacterized protein LAESUDRAFT_731977 [Laetiporus sulphureus 93-53]|uniref:ferric-chelate reductase (NADPH) n=1 Tax=Laetiporus sulphureus 93-53 TaxID=1314785 RepID=A0A165BCK7_9APHY|nr:uncharacterized protein LAESUDRAFT_731977 [Laetiporus sulphureus 93-53]KZT00744.1 hypothetical protein LAESUDRAFT_731977 [Laetiporus sulphureus 93-53]